MPISALADVAELENPCGITSPVVVEGVAHERWTEREYVHGPGGVDEVIAQFDVHNNALLTIPDGNGSVVALTTYTGDPVAQFTYGSYGEPLTLDSFAIHAGSRVGHQGLFFDRFDGEAHWPHLVPGSHGIYHNRNRGYSPELGRFLQRDPNATGAALLDSYGSHGRPIVSGLSSLDLHTLYTDGMNLYRYQRNDPVNGSDPMGLYDDPFEFIVDDTVAEIIGNRVATVEAVLGAINQSINTAVLMAELAVSMLPGADVVILGAAIARGKAGDIGFGDVFAAAASFIPGGGGGKFLGKVLGATADSRRAYSKTGLVRHHPIPMFLGGNRAQLLSHIPGEHHDEFHRILREELRKRDLNLPIGTPAGSANAWAAEFAKFEGSQQAAFDAVLEASRAIDLKHGTNITQDFWQNIVNQSYKAPP